MWPLASRISQPADRSRGHCRHTQGRGRRAEKACRARRGLVRRIARGDGAPSHGQQVPRFDCTLTRFAHTLRLNERMLATLRTLRHALPRFATLCLALPRFATLCHALPRSLCKVLPTNRRLAPRSPPPFADALHAAPRAARRPSTSNGSAISSSRCSRSRCSARAWSARQRSARLSSS